MDQALKQRLVGATVLIILGVIVLPMLLSGQPELQSESRRIEVPDQPPELSMETRRFPIGESPGEGPSAVPSKKPAPSANEPLTDTESRPAEARERENSPTPDRIADEETPRDEVTSAPETQDVATPPGRYLVQVASFSNPGNANQLSTLLTDNELPVVMDTVETAAGLLHRVRVGPYDKLDLARSSLEQIRALMADLNPRVVDLRPDEHAPVSDPSDPLVRWVVQAGSFTDLGNAEELVSRLKNAGFAAFLETVSDGRKSTHKVKIGPVIERGTALELEEELGREMNIDGIVMSVD